MPTKTGDTGSDLSWSAPDQFELGGANFRTTFGALHSQPDNFVLRKPRWLIEQYEALRAEFSGGRIVELGIDEGGSTAFMTELFHPGLMLALEIKPEPPRALAEFLAERGYASRIRPVFGVDQGDRERVSNLLDTHFGDERLDLVIDDASHVLEPSRVSFDILFPRLRPGGAFVIEDWSWDLAIERFVRDEPERFVAAYERRRHRPIEQRSGLGRLVAEAVVGAGHTPRAIDSVFAREGFALLRRGDAVLDPATFSLAECCGTLGQQIFADGSDLQPTS